jgi:hypothetical protein
MCPCAVTSNAHLTDPCVIGLCICERKIELPLIEVAIFPETGSDAVGASDALAVGEGLILEVGLTVDDPDVVVADTVADEVFVLAICGLVCVGDVQPATKIMAITAPTTSKENQFFLILLFQML